MEGTNSILICPDVHCRDIYKPLLEVKDKPVVFLGDYMDPYKYEGTNDFDGIANLEEIFDYAKSNKNVTLLIGNHDCSWTWSHLGWERTSHRFYNDLHKLYRENIDLLHPIHQVNDVIFTHAGICKGWINSLKLFKNGNFEITKENVIPYIENEFALELQSDQTPIHHSFYSYLNSPIFWVGRCRGGDAPYGGPVWCDFNYDYFDPEDWNVMQIFGHTQREVTGSIGEKGNGRCLDSRAIFELNLDTKEIKRIF